jgi:hypothetical protein
MLPKASLNALERAVVEALCTMHPEDESALRSQLSSVVVRHRTNTGAGFYSQLDVSGSVGAGAVHGAGRERNGPKASVQGIRHGMGFILWLDRGYASCLEGFSYDESTAGIAFDVVSFAINAIEDQRGEGSVDG